MANISTTDETVKQDIASLLARFPETAASIRASHGVSVETLHRARREGRVPAIRIGGAWRFRSDAVLDLIETSGDIPEISDRQAREIARLLGDSR